MSRINKYQIRVVAVLCMLICSNIIYAQKIATKDALSDFNYLNEAVINAHGVNYLSIHPINIGSVVKEIAALKTDSISIPDFRNYLGLALHEIGCLHTSIREFPLNAQLPEERFFPIPILLVNKELYIDNHKTKSSQKFVGEKIESINGYSSAFIVARLLNYLAGDGRASEDSYAKEIGGIYAPKLIAYYLNQPSKFKIKTSKGVFSVQSSEKPSYRYRTVIPMQKQARILEREKAYYLKRDAIPVLRIEKFMKEDASFWSEVFEEVLNENPPYLVIDLRGNVGGNRETGAELMRFLATEEFWYGILQPNQKPKPYLDKQGKRYYRFSKLKYNVGKFTHRRNTGDGIIFRFTYQPHEATYQGQIIVMTDGLTASTATMLSTWFDNKTNAKFIGRAAGGGYNGNNGGVFPTITLPCSKTVMRFPSYRIVLDNDYSRDEGREPDIKVAYSVEDWLTGTDKDWEAVLNFIQTQNN